MTTPTVFETISDQPEATEVSDLFIAAESQDPSKPTNKVSLSHLLDKSSEIFNYDGLIYKGVGNISDFAGQQLQATDKTNAYQYPNNSRRFYAADKSQTFPITIPVNPSIDTKWAQVNALSNDWGDIQNGTQVKHRRGTQSEVDNFTGALGEIVVNTTEEELVLGNSATQGGIPIAKKRNTLLSFDALTDVISNTALKSGYTVNIKERTTGSGGGGVWDVVPASSVTPNTFNIVQCTGVASLALVLRLYERMDIAQFLPAGQTDVTPVLSTMRDVGVKVAQVSSEYTIFSQFSYGDNFYIDCLPSGKLIVDGSVVTAGIVANNKANIGWGTLRLEGAGRAFVDGNERLIQFNSCTNIYGDLIELNNSTNFGLTFDSCSVIAIDKVVGDSNYSSLLQLRNGTKQGKINYVYGDNCGYSPNADIGPFGRCVTTWELSDFDFGTVITERASEYGFRLYSQADDTLPTKNITVGRVISKNCRREQGGSGVGFFIYNESGLISDVTVGQVHVDVPVQAARTHVGISLQGKDVTVGQVVLTTETAGNNVGIAYNSGDRISVMGGSAKKVGTLISYGSTSPATNTETKGLLCSEISEIAGVINGDGHKIKSISAKFASGHTLPAIALSDSYYTEVDDCDFDGAYRCISMNNSPSRITDNRSKNTVDAPVRKFGTGVTGLQMYANSWDKPSIPREVGNIDLIMPAGEIIPQCVVRTPVSPSGFTLNLPLRSIAYSTDQGLLSTHIGWVKTAAGTPGTWNTFGAITP